MRLLNLKILIQVILLVNSLNSLSNNTDTLYLLQNKYSELGNDSLNYSICTKISYVSLLPDEKIKYSILAYKIGVKLDKLNWQASSKHLESYGYILKGDIDKAISTLYKSLKIYEILNSKVGIAACLSDLGFTNQKNENFQNAEIFYKQAIALYEKLGDNFNLSATYQRIGELYEILHREEESIIFYIKSDSIYQSINYPLGIAYAKGNIGLVYIAQNKLDSAEHYLKKSIDILEPLEDNYAVSSYLDGLAEIYFKQKKYVKAKATAHKSLQLAEDYALKEQIRDASIRLSTIYKELRQFEKAFQYQSQYIIYRDSINNEETIRNIANLRAKYEVAQKQKEVDKQKSEKELLLITSICLILVLLLSVILIIIMYKNIKQRKQYTRQLELQHQELEAANATKNKFFSVLSHDLRSPLATYSSYSEILNMCVQHGEFDKASGICKEMELSSSKLLDLLDNLLQWGVNQMGSVEPIHSHVSVKDVVNMEVSHLGSIATQKNIEVHTHIPQEITLFVDRVSMSMAVRNLINNALKFTPSGGHITVSANKENNHTVIKVKDTGIGMTPEQTQKIFDFNNINSTYGTQNEKGIGLGLQLICGFIKTHHAKIDVESQLGLGTTFILTFDNGIVEKGMEG